MKKKKIPTIIGIIFLIFGIAAGVIMIQYRQFFRLGATGENNPDNVRISNLNSDSFSVSWTTSIVTSGFVKYGESQTSLSQIQEEEIGVAGYTHLVKIQNLKPKTLYYFKINSKEKDFDNNGLPWQTKTEPTLSNAEKPILISGTALTATSAPAANALVYLSANGKLLSALTSTNGSWVISIPFSVDPQRTLLEISVQAGPNGISSAQIYPQSAKPVPSMLLGQTYDFKSLPPNETTGLPEANLGVPEEKLVSSGFNLSGTQTATTSGTVTLDSIDEGEVITTNQPELLGKAPKGTEIKITVQSELITDEITVPPSGNWNWEIPANLSEGVHTITLNWKDAGGITRTLTRNFIVQASEGPAFVATPSTTLRASPSATPRTTASPRATATASATATATATPFEQPESGSLTPTLLLSIMGIGLVAFSLLLWKNAESN